MGIVLLIINFKVKYNNSFYEYMNKKVTPFLWEFQGNEPMTKTATSGEDSLTASVNEENKASIIETIYKK